jgi:hypothetical protein
MRWHIDFNKRGHKVPFSMYNRNIPIVCEKLLETWG